MLQESECRGKTRWGWWLTIFSLCAVSLSSQGAIWYQKGIGGPVVVHKGMVYFVQADCSLTVLDLASGQIVERLTERSSDLQVASCDAGLLVRGWEQLALLDWNTLDEVWSIPENPGIEAVRPGVIVLNSGDAVYAMRSDSGEPIWSVGGYAEHVEVYDELVLFSSSQNDETVVETTQTVYLIHIDTGRVLRHHTLAEPDGARRAYVFADGLIYAFDDPYQDSDKVTTHVLQNDGVLEVVELETIEQAHHTYVRIGEQYFGTGGWRASLSEVWPPEDAGGSLIHDVSSEMIYEVLGSAKAAAPSRFKIVNGERELKLIVPHLRQNTDDHPFFTVTEEFVLMSTSRGQVECLDRASGRSRWLYVSPWTMGLIAVSGGYVIDFGSLIRDFDAEKTDQSKRTPSAVMPHNAGWSMREAVVSQDARVIEDPAPFDPYAEWRGLWFMMRVSPYAFALLVATVLYLSWRLGNREWRWLGVASAALFCLPVPLLIYYCGFSRYASAALLVQMLLLGIAVLGVSIRELRQSRYLIAGLSLPTVCVAAWWVWPVLSYVSMMV